MHGDDDDKEYLKMEGVRQEGSTGTDDKHLLLKLRDRVVETMLENDESGGAVAASDVVMDQTVYGSFSKPEAEEVLVVCRILNTPHVGGLDRRAIIILEIYSGVVRELSKRYEKFLDIDSVFRYKLISNKRSLS